MNDALVDLDRRLVVAHRGDSVHAPENTLESFSRAVALGVDALEFDIRLTHDGVPVVIHDATLARTTDQTDVVAATSADHLRRADAGAMFSPDGGRSFPFRGHGLTVPTLAEVLAAFPQTAFLIEVKVPEAAGPIADALEKWGATSRTVVASMQTAAVAPLRAIGLRTGAVAVEVLELLGRALLASGPAALPFRALCIPRWYAGLRLPVKALARLAMKAGVPTHVWTIDSPRIASRLWLAGIQGIVTNDPEAMLALRAELEGRGR